MMLCARRGFLSLPKLPFGASEAQSHKVSRIISGSTQDVYRVVSGVDKYAEFIPFVENSFINSRDDKGVPTKGGLKVGWQNFEEEFVCNLNCVPGEKVVAESVTTALFDQLYTEWRFSPMGKQMTKVDLELRYQFKNPLYNSVSSMFSDQVTKIMIQAFQDRVLATTPNLR